MRLTRRDAIVALGAAGVAVGGGAAAFASDDEAAEPLGEPALRTMVAAADVLYPREVEDVDAFVRRFIRGRATADPARAAAFADAVAYLDEYAEAWHDARFQALDPTTRSSMFDRMGADTADPDPAGSDVERVRHYVINELLYALYASPTGGALIGLENPQGHPGGTASYRQGPNP